MGLPRRACAAPALAENKCLARRRNYGERTLGVRLRQLGSHTVPLARCDPDSHCFSRPATDGLSLSRRDVRSPVFSRCVEPWTRCRIHEPDVPIRVLRWLGAARAVRQASVRFCFLLSGGPRHLHVNPSLFRVVPAQGYLDHFVSDRSHMVSGSGAFSVACHENRRTLQLVQGQADVYLAEPPPYPPLRGSKASESQLKTNLMTSFVSMRVHDGDGALPRAADAAETQTYGKVLEMSKFVSWLAGELSSPDK